MSKRLVLLILVFLLSVVPAALGFGAETARQTLLRDGFILRGVDGKLTRQGDPAPIKRESEPCGCGSGWLFKFDSDVSDYRGRASAGTRLELLPSSELGKMIADVNERSAADYRLWGWVTKYEGRNFIFANYFFPLGKISRPQPQTPPKPRLKGQKPTESTSTKGSKQQPAISEPNDVLAIPQEIIERLKAGRIVRPERLDQTPEAEEGVGDSALAKKEELEQDSILADRTAFLSKREDGSFVFVLDAFGRNVRPVSLRLLPCEVLELAEQKQSAEPEPVRFKIAGIVTKYKGENYLLLQKAARIYSHQNFDR
ncbi:MAG: hypothetical protein WAV28_03125 [Sedimentisphaerales bacterium]|jgi:hypothetical protein